MASLKASTRGLEMIEQARKKRGWTKTASAWFQTAFTTEATLKRFWRQVPIQSDSFIKICQAVAVNWEEVIDPDSPLPGTSRIDWEQPLDVSVFYGRTQELNTLERLIVQDRCRLVVLSGMGGIGKTALVAKLWEKIKGEFDYVIERSLATPPPFPELLADLSEFLSEGNLLASNLSELMDCLRKHRCLLVLDSVETLLRPGKPPGLFRCECEDYAELVKRIRAEQHQSCLLLISREPPQETVYLRGEKIGALQLGGLGEEAQELLQAQGLKGTSRDLARLTEIYGGNPRSLKLISSTIQELFNGKVGEYIRQGTIVVVLTEILEQHFSRLSDLEIKIMITLAINQEPTSLQQLLENDSSTSMSEVMVAVQSLVRRSLVEKISGLSDITYTLQPEIRKYVTRNFVK